jgi:arylsulfatase A-like enzyme
MRFFSLFLALALLAPNTGCRRPEPGPSAIPAEAPPPVILISIDTLRADHLGCYGYHRPTSPSIDRLAADSVLFEQLINPGGATLPVHLSLMTSLPPLVHGIFAQQPHPLPEHHITLAEQLAATGYTTAAFTDGGFVSAQLGFAQGFEHFDDDGGHLARIMPRLESWLLDNLHRSFFLFLHTYDVHSGKEPLPYDSPEPYRHFFAAGYEGDFDGCAAGRCGSQLLSWLNSMARGGDTSASDLLSAEDLDYLVDLYDGGIRHADREIGELLDLLRERQVYDRCLIILTSDHGEEFREHGLLLHHQNYEENARVPLLIKLPGQAAAGTRVPALVSTIDIMPTVLELAGVAANPRIWGHSLVPVIAGEQAGRSFVHMASGPEKLRTAEWSLVLSRNQPIGLYDLLVDPHETENLIDRHPAVVSELTALYRSNRKRERAAHQAFTEGREAVPPPELSEELVNNLKALGYLE